MGPTLGPFLGVILRPPRVVLLLKLKKDFNSILIPESNSVIVKFLKNAAIVKTVSSICKFI